MENGQNMLQTVANTVENTMENERFELKTVAHTVEMAVSSSKMLQIAWKMVRTGNPKKIPQTLKKKSPNNFLPFLRSIMFFWQVHAAETSVWTSPPTSPQTAARTTRVRFRRRRCLIFSGNRWAAVVSLNHWLDLVGGFKIRKHVVSTWWRHVWCCFNVTWHEAFFLLVDGPTWLWLKWHQLIWRRWPLASVQLG